MMYLEDSVRIELAGDPTEHRVTLSVMTRLLLLTVLTITAACAKPQFVSGRPSDRDLPQKLGLSLCRFPRSCLCLSPTA